MHPLVVFAPRTRTARSAETTRGRVRASSEGLLKLRIQLLQDLQDTIVHLRRTHGGILLFDER